MPITIYPYHYEGIWVFGSEATGLKEEFMRLREGLLLNVKNALPGMSSICSANQTAHKPQGPTARPETASFCPDRSQGC